MFADEDHPSFDPPASDAVVWRYMDLMRYLSLLETRSLHFARADQMQDRWEGAYGPFNQQMRPSLYGEDYETMAPHFARIRELNRSITHLNCWHLSEAESAAMWEIYQREGRGVALRTTWAELTSSITSEHRVYGGKVRYVNYQEVYIPEGNLFDAFLYKRESYAHEQEVRLVMVSGGLPRLEQPGIGPVEEVVIAVPVDLDRLVNAIYVAPDAPTWMLHTIQAVTRRYGLAADVRQSDLANDPLD